MLSFELCMSINSVSRSEGRSATAAAAYRASCLIECEREGKVHDYRRKRGVEASEIVLPKDAPAWAKDRGKLWNAAELRERNKDKRAKSQDKANAQVAREIMFSLPAELSAAGRLAVARGLAAHFVAEHAVGVDFSLHDPSRDGDARNYHCHLMMTTRRLSAKGLGAKVEEWRDMKSGAVLAKRLRATLAGLMNDQLRAEGKANLVKVEHLSFKARGVARTPTKHEGPAKTHIRRKEQARARTAWFQGMARDQQERQSRDRAKLKLAQDFALQNKMGDLDRRERQGREAIRRELAEQQAADVPKKGMARFFELVTGRVMRADFDRQTRQAQRIETANAREAQLGRDLQAERATFMREQATEAQQLKQRHERDDQQLQQALTARERSDHADEQQQRRDQVRDPVQERTQTQTRQREGPELRL